MSSSVTGKKLSIAVVTALLLASSLTGANAATSPRAKSVAGREGAVANTILSGRGAPKNSLGVNGDFYIDVITYTIYGPKKNDKWPSGVNLKGPQGEVGKVGEKGSSGAAGTASKGDKGERGEKGEKGEKGEAGATGPAGPQGATGAQGAAGAQGAVGPAGAAGSQGLPGAAGSNGSAGAPGAKGDTGDKGDKGDDGSPGAKGDKGDTGLTGPSEVYIGAITFPSAVVGAPGQVIQSDTFGSLIMNKSYQVDLVVYGTGSVDTDTLPLKFELLVDGASPTISHVQWTNSSSKSYRTGQVVAEHSIHARFAINGLGVLSNYSFRVQLTTGGTILSGRDISFRGSFRIQLVGTVTP